MNKEKPKYYIIKDLDTGLYYRGKGQNRWGKYYNQASIFRNLAQANNSVEQLKRYDKSNAVAIEIEITEIAQNPTLLECIKEWEERGWSVSELKQFPVIKIWKLNKEQDVIDNIYVYPKKLNSTIDFNADYGTLNLLTKTLKALEAEDEK